MFNINGRIRERIKDYIMSCGFEDKIAEFYLWRSLSYQDPGNCITISSDVSELYIANEYCDDENKQNILIKLYTYNISTCVLLVVLKVIKYPGKILLRLTTRGYKLLRHSEFNDSEIIDTTLPRYSTEIERNYFEALVMFGTPDMLIDYIDKLNKFPNKAADIAKDITIYISDIDTIHNMENKSIFIRFMNEYNNKEDISL